MGRSDSKGKKRRARKQAPVRHPKRNTTSKTPPAAREAADRLRQALPKMQDFSAVAPPQYTAVFNATNSTHLCHQQKVELLGTMWHSIDGFRFQEQSLTDDELTHLAATFGFLVQPNACDIFVRLFAGIFRSMLSHKMAYCNNPEANRHFFAFVRLQHYNSLLGGRARGQLDTADLARALASLDVDLMIKVIDSLINSRRALLDAAMEEDKVAEDTVESPPAVTQPVTQPLSEFEKAAMALSCQMATHMVMEDTGLSNNGGVDDNDNQSKKAINDYLALPETNGIKWSKQLLQSLCEPLNAWIREKFVGKQEKQAVDEWTKVFGKMADRN
ncbi:hypothetical protein CONLIGDRAFT_678094 [Coniochaeta ligniaria NRRL 30616]|uniref:Uncharacterized protein n=1 Tax=Coniochaeta ligniaria NRRL 30616 TaxID=1408157 RepID=A0A1J7IWF0_9PEZI|nr:hypothetical protein CONLIGDRAFT_678094 [Coniochaeta ligniaria NRRL 30616]